jgi:septum formation protein
VTALKLRAARARARRRGLPGRPILTSDTTVALGRRILGKPADAAQARAMLASLSGRTHRVLTAVALWTGRRTLAALSDSRVHVAPIPAADIDRYVAGGEPFGKAGAYAIQGAFAAWISRIDGSHSGIMGLPLHETATLLRQARVSF